MMVAGTRVFVSKIVPAVAKMGPPVRIFTWVPVAKINSAINGSALFLNKAVVKPPISMASGAKVPMRDPAISGSNIRPPGTFIMAWYMGKRETSLFMGGSEPSDARSGSRHRSGMSCKRFESEFTPDTYMLYVQKNACHKKVLYI